ncbi:cytochrome p450-like protein [Trypanosoma cruzi]|nr:cytochrome p450-like protein [Trypanosoma cruzi]
MTLISNVLGVQIPYLAEVAAIMLIAHGLAYLLTMFYFARKHKFSIPGPKFVTPLLGGLVMMMKDPYTFWEKQRRYCPSGYSWLSILNQFTVFVTRADLCHKIFATNSENTLTLQLHPNGRIILGDNNIAFQCGPRHKALRASFLNLFATKALSLYLPIQERLIREHLAEWVKKYPFEGKPEEMRGHIRELNCKTSQTVFVGEHLLDPEEFTRNYNIITVGFLSLPLYFPGTALYKAVQARKKVVDELKAAVIRSKARMSLPDAEAHCVLDFWSATILETLKACEDEGVDPPPFASDDAMAETLLDFLFASQDASTASLVMITATMADRPDILERVRQEQAKLCAGDEPLTFDLVQEMTFTRQCVLEQLRLFPPAPMVPMKAHSDFVIDGHYTVPKGSLIIPSLVGACREGFPNPDVYDPDRMGSERQEDRKFAKQFIPFGVGPHRCVGYNYAINHLTVYLALVARLAEWRRTRTPNSDKVIYLPTLYPHDCLCTWRHREGLKAGK